LKAASLSFTKVWSIIREIHNEISYQCLVSMPTLNIMIIHTYCVIFCHLFSSPYALGAFIIIYA
ncbi:hypothetical protein T4D_2760, partial [Trichinella pseudospiralis]